MDLLSVIILSLGDSEGARLTKESVEAQSLKPQECIVFNVDESRYDTFAQVKNDAVKKANYDSVLLVNAGVILPLNALEIIVSCDDNVADITIEQATKQRIGHTTKLIAKHNFNEVIPGGDMSFDLMLVDRRVLGVAGGWNEGLAAAEDYELLLRIYDICQLDENIFSYSDNDNVCGDVYKTGCAGACGVKVLKLEESVKAVTMETYRTYAYVLARYAMKLKKDGLFDKAFLARYNEAQVYGIGDYFTANMESMLSRGEEFESLEKNTRPILVVTGETVCYGTLDIFAKNFAQALRDIGQNVVEFSIRDKGVDCELGITENDYKAVVGLQTAFFTTDIAKGKLIGNMFACPKYNFIFDHPLYVSYHLMLPVKNLNILAQDSDYADYVSGYYDNIESSIHFPPAGNYAASLSCLAESSIADAKRVTDADTDIDKKTDADAHKACYQDIYAEREYDFTFVGTYNNYRDRLKVIAGMESERRKCALKLLNYMKHNPNVAVEKAFKYVLSDMKIVCEKKDFVVRLHHMMEVGRALIFYYREKIVRTLLDSGVELHVFSKSWYSAPFASHPKLIIHDDVSYEESLEIFAKSRVSLNVMSWHKAGMTERVANTMLNGAVCVTDKTSYIEEHFEDGKDIVLFDLGRIQELPGKVKKLLGKDNKENVWQIAIEGRKKAADEHMWSHRAKEFMKLIGE